MYIYLYICVCACTDEVLNVYMQQKFIWDPQHEARVGWKWKEKTRVRLKDFVNKAVNEDPNKIITWMTDDIRASLKYRRENDEEFKRRSE